MQDVDVHEATEADIPAIGALFKEMWRESGPNAPGFAGATEKVIAEISEPDAIRARIGGPERRMFLASVGGTVAGFAATREVDAVEIELAGIVVLATMQGRGIGRPLVAVAVETARNHGYRRMTVSTERTNERAIGFYEACGFRIVGESIATVEGTEVEVVELDRSL